MDACSSDIDACSLPVEVTTAVHVAQEHALGGEAVCTHWCSGVHSMAQWHAHSEVKQHTHSGAVVRTQ
eukprot:scaffold215572_cov21-Tisochrysis_lutea.AAC.2